MSFPRRMSAGLALLRPGDAAAPPRLVPRHAAAGETPSTAIAIDLPGTDVTGLSDKAQRARHARAIFRRCEPVAEGRLTVGGLPSRASAPLPAPLNLLGPGAAHRLHAIHPAMPGHEAAATAFALAMIQVFSDQALSSGQPGPSRVPLRPLLWVQAETASTESGSPYAPGLAALGLDPTGLVVVKAANALATLAAAEMGLEEAGLAGIIVELPARLPADMLKPGKRLSLRASQTRTPCLLLHATATPVEMPVASRWTVRARTPPAGRAAAMPDLTSAFDLQLTKNRFGPLGRWSLAWQSEPAGPPDLAPLAQPNLHDRSDHPRFIFAPLPPLPEPVAAASADRPPGASRRAQPRPQRDTTAA